MSRTALAALAVSFFALAPGLAFADSVSFSPDPFTPADVTSTAWAFTVDSGVLVQPYLTVYFPDGTPTLGLDSLDPTVYTGAQVGSSICDFAFNGVLCNAIGTNPLSPTGTWTVVLFDHSVGSGGACADDTSTLAQCEGDPAYDVESTFVVSATSPPAPSGGFSFLSSNTAAAAAGVLGGFTSTDVESLFLLVILALSIPLAFYILREIIALFPAGRYGPR